MSEEPIFTHELREPVKNVAGEEVTTLVFRRPRGGDIIRCGNPVKYQPYSEEQEIGFDELKAAKMMAALTGVPMPMIERMDPNDFADCCWGMARFFLPWMKRPDAS